ncbi:hypothetical protein ASE91_05375 [Sphingomonas sp. Leaf62]|nr:hypothetical protein ASE91_05375 [Sphingomonas sp. Leaf62]
MPNRHLLNQLAQLAGDKLGRARAVSVHQLPHAAAVGLGDCRVQRDHFNGTQLGALADKAFSIRLPRDQRFADHSEVGRACLDRSHQPAECHVDFGDALVDCSRAPPPVAGRSGDLVVIGLHQQRNRFRAQQLIDQTCQDTALDLRARKRTLLVAGAGLARSRAAKPSCVNGSEPAAAFAAPDQSRQQVPWAVALG